MPPFAAVAVGVQRGQQQIEEERVLATKKHGILLNSDLALLNNVAERLGTGEGRIERLVLQEDPLRFVCQAAILRWLQTILVCHIESALTKPSGAQGAAIGAEPRRPEVERLGASGDNVLTFHT